MCLMKVNVQIHLRTKGWCGLRQSGKNGPCTVIMYTLWLWDLNLSWPITFFCREGWKAERLTFWLVEILSSKKGSWQKIWSVMHDQQLRWLSMFFRNMTGTGLRWREILKSTRASWNVLIGDWWSLKTDSLWLEWKWEGLNLAIQSHTFPNLNVAYKVLLDLQNTHTVWSRQLLLT